jgi:hypothetical protein
MNRHTLVVVRAGGAPPVRGLDPPFTAQEIERATVANDVFVVALEHIKAQRQLT